MLAATEIGVGHKGLAKFCGVMSVPPPMNKTAYKGIVNVLKSAAGTVENKSITVVASESKTFYLAERLHKKPN